jgi:hypothetical protein
MRFPIVCCCLLLRAVGTYAQLQEHFNYPHIDSAVSWKGSDTAWQVKNGMLQSHFRQASSNFYVATPSFATAPYSWEWWMRLDFNTSSLNYADVYLMADSANLLSAAVKGYFVRIGNTKDEVCLYRKSVNATPIMIIDGRDGITDHSSNVLKVKVVCDEDHEWSLWVDDSGTGNNYVLEGSVKDSSLRNAGYMGFAVKQSTASFFEKHFFDDVVVGPLVKDTVLPELLSLQLVGDRELDLCFSEPLDSNSVYMEGNFLINGVLAPASLVFQRTCIRLLWDSPFPNGDSCRLAVKGIRDMTGNLITPVNTSFLYYKVGNGDVVINEILYDGTPEFIELYNRGVNAVNMKELYLSKGKTGDSVALSSSDLLLLPGGYAAFTSDPEALCMRYHCKQPENIYKMNLPALINKEGTIILLGPGGSILDELHYSDDMQFALADNTKGVSLERLDAGMPAQDPHNWHSAASTAGYATPGSVNSQQLQIATLPGALNITPEIFSPDNDGKDDVAVISYILPAPGYVANITVYDAGGRPVRYLQHNTLLEVKGQMIWDGLGESNKVLATGIYIVFTEMFDLKGQVKRWKLPIVLAKRMN